MNDKPSLETITQLYLAAVKQKETSDRSLDHIRLLIVKYGYTEDQVIASQLKKAS